MDVLTAIEQQPDAFLQPQPALFESALRLAKQYLDPVATEITNVQDSRLRATRKSRKRKRGSRNDDEDDDDDEEMLKVKQIYTEGLDISQVWHQARRILDAASTELDRSLPDPRSDAGSQVNQEFNSINSDDDLSDASDDGELGEEGVDWVYDGDDVSEKEAPSDLDEQDDLSAEADSVARDGDTPLSDYSDGASDGANDGELLVKDRHGLNDGFFSIDQFNKSTQFLEQQDARGDPDDGAASDEEEVDWTADPLTQGFAASGSFNKEQRIRNDEESEQDDDDEDDEDGPTFGNANLKGLDGDDDDADGAMDDLDTDATGMGGDFSNTNNILYSDFFAPPARNVPKSKKQGKRTGRFQDRGNAIKQPLAKEDDAADGESDEEYQELKRTMAGVQRDLFDDDDSDEDGQMEGEDDPSELKPGQRNLSNHERRQLALRAEIRRLEAENVAEKPWALSGETMAPARPQNALLEEDLDFERAGKPLPIITVEVNESIEELIKRRILSKEFDEVRRRRPDEVFMDGNKDPRRGKIEELSDAKSKKGLAEEYEDDYLRKNDPNHVDSRSEALKAKHREIEQQWASVSAQLDALSNWHYKPRHAAPALDVRVDVPTVALEDARPTAGGEVAGASAIAPQELYKVGSDGKRTGEVVTKGGTVTAREEETRDQRRRRRQRQKERRHKLENNKALLPPSTDNQDASGKPKRASKADVVGQLKRGKVKVIGKKGELQDVEGNAVRAKSAGVGAGNYKL